MEAKEFDVEVVYRQRAVYRVRAPDREAAERMGVQCWQSSRRSAMEGYDWSEVESVHAEEGADPQRVEQDALLAIRFLAQREELILRLGGSGLSPSANDAISAAQVASDLGWSRNGGTSGPEPDITRATRALERLCEQKKVVCFQRPRVRTGERGDIRLYCTSEYLDTLSAELEDEVVQGSTRRVG